MKITRRLTAAAAAVALSSAFLVGGALASPAGASTLDRSHRAAPAVFVQTDNVAGNQVVAYHRAADGRLSEAGAYDTGGLGGSLTGAVVDRTASQGSLTFDADSSKLFAVNAGSNSVSVFSVSGARLHLDQIVNSGGTFPVSVTVHHHLVYVLNARSGGSVSGYYLVFGHLFPIPASTRPLGLDPTLTPEFTRTPGQVAFTPNGSRLLVTTKAASASVDTFSVRFDGRLSASPVVTTFPGAVPFGIVFDRFGHAVLANAGTNSVLTAHINADNTLTAIESAATGQGATCWIVEAGDDVYASNAGSATLTGLAGDGSGHLSLIGQTPTDAGTIDAAATPSGDYLYVQTGAAGNVNEFHVNADGSLTSIGSVTVPAAIGGEGIVAT